jgi:VanZ family protein
LPSRERLTRWLAVAAWATLISILSTQWFSGERTGGILLPLLARLLPSADPATLAAVHQAVRKLAHVAEYLVLSVLLYRALTDGRAWNPRAAVLAVGTAGLYAVADEAHQLFVPGRGAAFSDVLIDLSGAILAQVLIVIRRPTLASIV